MIRLNAIGVANNDKANPNTRHTWYPDVTFPMEDGTRLSNLSLPANERVYVVCDYLTVGDRDKYMNVDVNGNARVNFAELFMGQVCEIHRLTHPTEDREITVKELTEVYGGEGSSVAQAIITDIAVHLMKGSELTEEEKKN
jgi:hypothetical protein